MKYGYLEGEPDPSGHSQGCFSKIITPPQLTKIGLSPNHTHGELRIEVNNGPDHEAAIRREITLELTSLCRFSYSPSRCLIRPTRNEDYALPIPGSPEYFRNTRILVTESGKSLGELLPIIKLCWKSASKVRFILNSPDPTSNNDAGFMTSNNLTISLSMESCPTYKSIDSMLGGTRHQAPPAYRELYHADPRRVCETRLIT
ncbi:hypothetical protein K493DRAFT_308844 [Basidiobolus meristosporus CBS 931.73]|uniref:Uncharacterized protein n=1 Tax=Basidiobolus meristosporus CBS 931.73 TaxID=1314790 RepID=A0A1Y1WVY5_9FUNG|nr:hypothetical protein K493DRAFT_308844 [Basidiobolus meristosporus CBS 931.73]|eukprot:ORX77707.1 hypothetical protein K493DRAFT_308844 [Basidiobolus meristosporus CBS 931.73]